MVSSIPLSVAFTVAFVVTGVYALVRFALVAADGDRGGDRPVELSHLLMSVAMIAMTWGAGVGGVARTLQIAAFGGFALWFLCRVILVRTGSRHGRLLDADHAVTAAAMVWMVVAMPLIMGTPMADGDAGHAAHGSGGAAGGAMPGTDDMAAPAPAWVVAVSVAFVVLLAAGALLWAHRAWRGGEEPTPAARPVGDSVDGGTAVAVQTRAADARTGLAALTGPRRDAVCHLLMNVGMAAMLLAMM